MLAARLDAHDGPDRIRVGELPEPVPGPDDVLVDVRAAGLSFPDLLMTRGKYQFLPPLPHAIGADVVGTCRTDVPDARVAAGDRVASVISHGAAAEVAAVPAGRLLAVPDALSDAEAATMPLAYLTAHLTLVTRAQARPGEWVLINGATGSVGSALIQVAKACGCRVVALARRPEQREQLASADVVIDEWAKDTIRSATDGHGADIVTDVVGTDEVVLEALRSLAPAGRLMTLGFVGGTIPQIRANRLLLGNTDVRGVAWGPYSRAHPGHMQAQWADIVRWRAEGLLSPPTPQVRPLAETASALRAIAAGGAPRQVVVP